MQLIEIDLPPGSSPSETLIERCCAENNLQVTLKGTLSKYPGCVHWHLKQGKQHGTLEITWWPEQHRLWLSIQAGRTGLETAAQALKEKLIAALRDSNL
jgi:hypothetical protein